MHLAFLEEDLISFYLAGAVDTHVETSGLAAGSIMDAGGELNDEWTARIDSTAGERAR